MRFILLLLILTSNVFARPTFTVGSRGSFQENSGKYQNALNYYQVDYHKEDFLDSFSYKTHFEFRVFDPISTDEKPIIDPINVSVELLYDKVAFQMGFLRYRFSETFGLQILDIANPRDYSEYFLNDLSWAKRSIFGLNMLNKIGRLEVLWMMTLWGNGDRLPYKGSPYDLTKGELGYEGGVVEKPWFKDYEYGARFKYLFESGLDFSILAYRHFSRPTLVSIHEVSPFIYSTNTSRIMVNSLGMAGSYVHEDWVIRGDALVTFGDTFITGPLNFEEKDHTQYLVGVDRVWNDWTFGLQYQQDFTYKRQFYGGKVEYNYFENWKPSAMIFLGNKNSDQWFQVKNTFEYSVLKLNLVYDSINGAMNSQSLFGFYKKNDRFLIDLSLSY